MVDKMGCRFVYGGILGFVGCVLGGLVWGFMGGEKRDGGKECKERRREVRKRRVVGVEKKRGKGRR